VIALAIESSPGKRLMLHEIYEVRWRQSQRHFMVTFLITLWLPFVPLVDVPQALHRHPPQTDHQHYLPR
jgi:hypothetical protein